MYPLFSWTTMTIVTVVSTPRAIFRRHGATSHWHTERVAVEYDSAVLPEPEQAAA